MAVTFVAAGAAASDTASVTIGVPSSYAADDLFLLMVESANQSITAPSGWTEIGSQASQGTGTAGAAGATRLAVFYKFATSSESSVTVADSGDHTTGIMLGFRGVSSTSTFNANASGIDSSATDSLSWPTVTTTADGCMIVNCVATDNDGLSTSRFSSWANSSLVSITECADRTSSTNNGGGFGAAYGIKTSAGAVSATTCTEASAMVHGYLTLALTPSGGATTNNLTGSIDGTSSISGSITVTKPLTGSIDGVSELTGSITVTKPLTGSIDGLSSLTGNLTVEKLLSGSIDGVSSFTANLTNVDANTKLLTGTISANGTFTGDLTVEGTGNKFVKISGTWVECETYVKISGTYVPCDIYKKKDNSYTN